MNIEVKKKFEFLESFSAIMDAHLRYFKLVSPLYYGSIYFLLVDLWSSANKFILVISLGLWIAKPNGALYSSGSFWFSFYLSILSLLSKEYWV